MLRQTYHSPLLPRGPIARSWTPSDGNARGTIVKYFVRDPNTKLRIIDPFAFLAALIASPILVALLGCWALFIPVFAVIFGGPIYLIVGTPVLLWYLGRHPASPLRIACLAFTVNVVACALLVLLSEIGQFQTMGIPRELLWFGLIFAPLWGACFGLLYPKFERDFYHNLNT